MSRIKFAYHSRLKIITFFFNSFIFSQSAYLSHDQLLPLSPLFDELVTTFRAPNEYHQQKIKLSFNSHGIVNSGHSNIDNASEIFAPGNSTSAFSFRFSYASNFLLLNLEPYQINHSNYFFSSPPIGALQYTNNYTDNNFFKKKSIGFKQSNIVIHFNGLGIGYGKMSNWWGPGFHSAIALSSNAPSRLTYVLGTFDNISLNKLSIGFQFLASPGENYLNQKIYFTGMKSQIIYDSDPKITVGFHRTFLSGDFPENSINNKTNSTWSFEDAIGLIFNPLFGQKKSSLSFTIPGTPGFDRWDEVLTGYIKLNFTDQNLELYIDLASDDSRANFVDLRAHWDHTLAYQIGFKKFFNFNKYVTFLGYEITSTIESNTFKSEFYRGKPNIIHYYSKPDYDYFTYNGRFMGAHSGSSSRDAIYIFGISNYKATCFLSFNNEIHGIKAEQFPEIKNEISLFLGYKYSINHSIFLNVESEKINNFNFKNNKISQSRMLWLGYSYHFKI